MMLLKKICPICAIVSLSWAMLLALKALGYAVDEPLIAMLMGGSVVGVSFALGKRWDERVSQKHWKLVSIPAGFAFMYALLAFSWGFVLLALAAYAVAWMFFENKSVNRNLSKKRENNIASALDRCCD